MQERNIPVHNPGPNVMYVGSAMIAAGDTRHFFLHEVPRHLRPDAPVAVAPKPAGDEVDQLLAKPLPELRNALPGMSKEQLNALGQREFDKGPGARRDGVLTAIEKAMFAQLDAEREAREKAEQEAAAARQAAADAEAQAASAELARRQAEDQANGAAAIAALKAKNVKEIAAALPGLSDTDLSALETLEKADAFARKTVLEALEAEMLKRAGGEG